MEKVGIVGYYQVKLHSDANYGRYEMIFEAVRGAVDMAGLKKKDISTVIHAQTIIMTGVLFQIVLLSKLVEDIWQMRVK